MNELDARKIVRLLDARDKLAWTVRHIEAFKEERKNHKNKYMSVHVKLDSLLECPPGGAGINMWAVPELREQIENFQVQVETLFWDQIMPLIQQDIEDRLDEYKVERTKLKIRGQQ